MFKRKLKEHIQVITLTLMLTFSIALVFSAFVNFRAMANPPGPEPEGFYYKWECGTCNIYNPACYVTPYYKKCDRYICEGGVGCWPTGEWDYFCCDVNP